MGGQVKAWSLVLDGFQPNTRLKSRARYLISRLEQPSNSCHWHRRSRRAWRIYKMAIERSTKRAEAKSICALRIAEISGCILQKIVRIALARNPMRAFAGVLMAC